MVVCSNANNEEDQIDEHDGSNKNYQDRKPLQPGANTKMTISYQHNARTRNTHTRAHTQNTHTRARSLTKKKICRARINMILLLKQVGVGVAIL